MTIVGSITTLVERYDAITGKWVVEMSYTIYCYGHSDERPPPQQGYGPIRAGCAEGGLMSDFTVDELICTSSKRG